MAQKKCSKCGELNPPEAVMCWACYTPLSGGGAPTAAGMAAGGGGALRANAEVTHAKKAVEPWQLGVIGVGVLIAVVMGARAMMGGSGDGSVVETVSAAPPTSVPDSTSPNAAPMVAPAALSGGGGGGGGGGASSPSIAPAVLPQPGKMAFTISLPPRRGVPWTTMAIVPTQAGTTPQAAASLAAAARQQLVGTGNWKGMYIYVFSDKASAAKLRAFQSKRAGKPLGQNDYQTLLAIWPLTLARYEYSKGWEAIRYPATNPSGWWQGESKYGKATL